MFFSKLLVFLMCLWFGAYILAGYGVAPLLFQQLPQQQAGYLAGVLFDVVNYAGLLVWGLVYLAGRSAQGHRYERSHTGKIVAFTWLLLAASQFLITPVIKALREKQTYWLHDWVGGSFAAWHGTSSSIYLLVSLITLFLLLRLLKFEWR
ncbi:DUF4149 domain-containing protein [Neisseria shayeganii]|uniref:DUF4149 domain-containing protein n=1 Tax=Neisseria shayeganii TaxID=607712 RepID=A0A7D7S720_9NEIS|nr:DUF4149 domain-containing protein [Neisseria shayeganii]QMT39571.1 DUF4149 domain-containing protein [Neisseria shayeganii]